MKHLRTHSLVVESGAVMVEAAIVAPFFLFFALSLFDIGNMLYIHSQLRSVVREVARTGAGVPALEYGEFSLTYLEPPPTGTDPALRCTPSYDNYACQSPNCDISPRARQLVCVGYSFLRLALLGSPTDPLRTAGYVDRTAFKVTVFRNPSDPFIPGYDASYPPDSVTATAKALYLGTLLPQTNIYARATGPYL